MIFPSHAPCICHISILLTPKAIITMTPSHSYVYSYLLYYFVLYVIIMYSGWQVDFLFPLLWNFGKLTLMFNYVISKKQVSNLQDKKFDYLNISYVV